MQQIKAHHSAGLSSTFPHPIMSTLSGHLMGKKSIEGLPEPQETDGDYLTPSDTAEPVELSSYERLMQALIRQTNQKQMKAHIPQRLLGLRSGWRAEDRDKYLREVSATESLNLGVSFYHFGCRMLCIYFLIALQMSDLLLLALKLQDDDAAWVKTQVLVHNLLDMYPVTTHPLYLVCFCSENLPEPLMQFILAIISNL